MEPKIIIKDEFNLIGIQTRTKNADEMTGQGKIGQLWGRFASEKVVEQIPDKTDGCAYGLYTDFESDENGLYTLIIGTGSKSLDNIPAGMTGLRIPTSKYAVFTSRRGPLPDVNFELWQQIWDWSHQDGVERTFAYDFEVYDERSMDFNDAEIDIYVGIA